MPTLPAHDFLSIDESATTLETTPLAVRRLVARKTLPATRLGEGGSFRIPAADLNAYIGHNAPDLIPPVWSTQTERANGAFAQRFADAVIEAAEDQVLSDEQARELFADSPMSDSIDFKLTVTPAIRAVVESPVPASVFAPPKQQPPDYPDWRFLYLVVYLREAAEKVLRRGALGLRGGDIYESPERYTEVVAAATTRVLEQKITFSKNHLIEQKALGSWKTIFYVLSHTAIAPAEIMAAVTQSAF